MADNSAIEWTDSTWNPIVGCSVVSPGCTNCYAMGVAGGRAKRTAKYEGLTKPTKGGAVWTGDVRLWEKEMLHPLLWRRPRKIFVNSMGDLFHENVPDEWIDKVFAVMALAPHHTFQVLTKRAERMRAYLSAARAHPVGLAAMDQTLRSMASDPRSRVGDGIMLQGDIVHLKVWPLPNVWLGVSAEDQARADERIPLLLQTPAAVRFISAEPLLGPLDLKRWVAIDWQCSSCHAFFSGGHRPSCPDCGAEGGWTGSHTFNGRHAKYGNRDRGSGLDWVIVGGESGRKARPMHPDWARSLRDQCVAAGVPFFFKQWGTFAATYDRDIEDRDWRRCGEVEQLTPQGRWLNLEGGHGFHGDRVVRVSPVGKAIAGRDLDGRTWDEFPAVAP